MIGSCRDGSQLNGCSFNIFKKVACIRRVDHEILLALETFCPTMNKSKWITSNAQNSSKQEIFKCIFREGQNGIGAVAKFKGIKKQTMRTVQEFGQV